MLIIQMILGMLLVAVVGDDVVLILMLGFYVKMYHLLNQGMEIALFPWGKPVGLLEYLEFLLLYY